MHRPSNAVLNEYLASLSLLNANISWDRFHFGEAIVLDHRKDTLEPLYFAYVEFFLLVQSSKFIYKDARLVQLAAPFRVARRVRFRLIRIETPQFP